MGRAMSQLPPDPERLRVILAYLERRIAENGTIGTYLRLQRKAVQEALARAERPRERGPRRPPKGGGSLPAFAPVPQREGFVVQQARTPRGPEPAVIHVGGCPMIEGPVHRVDDHDARVALCGPTVTACAFCRPDTELGIDLA